MKNIYDDSGNNSEPDYENNLAFPPQEIKSQDDIRKLIKAVEKCEKLEKQLKIAVEALKEIYVNTKGGRILCDFCHSAVECEGCVNQDVAEKTLKQIKELDK